MLQKYFLEYNQSLLGLEERNRFLVKEDRRLRALGNDQTVITGLTVADPLCVFLVALIPL